MHHSGINYWLIKFIVKCLNLYSWTPKKGRINNNEDNNDNNVQESKFVGILQGNKFVNNRYYSYYYLEGLKKEKDIRKAAMTFSDKLQQPKMANFLANSKLKAEANFVTATLDLTSYAISVSTQVLEYSKIDWIIWAHSQARYSMIQTHEICILLDSKYQVICAWYSSSYTTYTPFKMWYSL